MGNASFQTFTPEGGVAMEITPVTPTGRTAKVRATKTVVPKSSSKAAPTVVAPPPTAARKRKVLTRKSTVPAAPDLTGMIAIAAYYLAERRQFVPGQELADWLTAEQQIIGNVVSS
jgi:Protein of unknown function (DUF2934)